MALQHLSERGENALMRACYSNCTEAALALIPLTENLNQQNMYGDTALMMACRRVMRDVVTNLIHHGAQLTLADHFGYTALMHACDSDPEIADEIACCGKDVAINHRATNGNDALLIAAQRAQHFSDDSDMAQSFMCLALNLLSRGATADAREKQKNHTALIHCLVKGYTVIVDELLKRETTLLSGSDFNEQNDNVLTYALEKNMTYVVAALLKHPRFIKDDLVNHRRKDGKNPLLLAWNNTDVAIALVNAGADVNYQDESGESLLMRACGSNIPELARAMIQASEKLKTPMKYLTATLTSSSGNTASSISANSCTSNNNNNNTTTTTTASAAATILKFKKSQEPTEQLSTTSGASDERPRSASPRIRTKTKMYKPDTSRWQRFKRTKPDSRIRRQHTSQQKEEVVKIYDDGDDENLTAADSDHSHEEK